jgi:hypothetical protein
MMETKMAKYVASILLLAVYLGVNAHAQSEEPKPFPEPVAFVPLPTESDPGSVLGAAPIRTPWVDSSKTVLPTTSTPRLLAVLYTDAQTCIVGNPCTSGTCINITRPDGSVFMQFQDNGNFTGLRPSDPTRPSYPQQLCLHLVLTAAEVSAVRAELASFAQQVAAASSSQMVPILTIEERGPVELSMTKWGQGLFIAPWDSRVDARPFSSGETDGFSVTSGMLDYGLNIRIPIPACGGTYGADYGAWGSGHSWIPKSNGYWFECSTAQVYFHEWLHQVDWASANNMLIPDLYGESFPACGLGDPDRHRWFPSADRCNGDPDRQDCGSANCQLDLWNAHVLGAHYNFPSPYVGNHCRDRRRDWGESGVDTGTDCIGPGEAGATAPLRVTAYNKTTGALTASYGSACGSGDNTIEYGPIASLPAYGYTGQVCGIGNSGTTSFQVPNGSFFLVVASSGGKEGSYGRRRQAGTYTERPEDVGSMCVLPQDLGNRCD